MTALAEPDFAARRARALGRMEPHAALVLPAAPELVVGRDTEIPYRPDPNLLYLTGSPLPGTVAVLAPGRQAGPFVLFSPSRDEERERWTGAREEPAAIAERLGADAGYPLEEIERRLPRMLAQVDTIYFPLGWGRPELERLVLDALTRGRRTRQRKGRGPRALVDAGAVLDELRLIKDETEIARMRAAAAATVAGFEEARPVVRAGRGEWEVQAAAEAAFLRRTGARPAFPTIAAAGASATVLHYTRNDRTLRQGELLLLDAGATVDGYHADVTRTWAVGTIEPERRALHALVAEARDAAIAAVAPGRTEADVHQAALRVLLRGMHERGLVDDPPDVVLAAEEERRNAPAAELATAGAGSAGPAGGRARSPRRSGRRAIGGRPAATERPAYTRYFPHRVSHWLGLEVHDVGDYERDGRPRPLEPGMVLTVEPGLYLPADDERTPPGLRGVGIRLEDDVLVTADGHEVLSGALPLDVDPGE